MDERPVAEFIRQASKQGQGAVWGRFGDGRSRRQTRGPGSWSQLSAGLELNEVDR